MITNEYFKEYRAILGFTNKDDCKKFLSAKDIKPNIDFNYIELLNIRLKEILLKINSSIYKPLQKNNIDSYANNLIKNTFNLLKDSNTINKLNNQGRRVEEVYFSYTRGLIISNFFMDTIKQMFNLKEGEIRFIGDDNLNNINSFKRTPKADLEIIVNGEKIYLEIQSGFQGVNDIKQHKVLEAKKQYLGNNIKSLLIHFDVFNGQVAFINLYNIEDEDINWITRQQLEGQTVFNIEQNFFIWKITNQPPKMSEFL
jgi:hypothetical protein